jgi:sulfopyruvate decarboxylase alpha subunit
MTWEQAVVRSFKENDVDFVAHIPDSALAGLIDLLEEDDYFTTTVVAREEEAVGMVSGAWLGGRRGALICQSSGLSNSFNALGSLCKPWGLPFVGLVTRRGNLGEHNLAQVEAGYNLGALLDDIGIRNYSLDGAHDVRHCVDQGIQTAFGTEEPYVLLLENTLMGGK